MGKERGFTLVEVLVALLLLAVIASAMLYFANAATQGAQIDAERRVALALAEETAASIVSAGTSSVSAPTGCVEPSAGTFSCAGIQYQVNAQSAQASWVPQALSQSLSWWRVDVSWRPFGLSSAESVKLGFAVDQGLSSLTSRSR